MAALTRAGALKIAGGPLPAGMAPIHRHTNSSALAGGNVVDVRHPLLIERFSLKIAVKQLGRHRTSLSPYNAPGRANQ
jgi:hypothetical protein